MKFRLLLLLVLSLASSYAFASDIEPPRVGDEPPFDLGEALDGRAVDLRDYRGKAVIVTFWASWCGPCLKELPILGHVQDTVGRDALEVIAVNHKEPRREVLALVRANRNLKLTWVPDARGAANARYGIRALPHMFIIGADGRVAAVHRGYSEASLPRIVEEILAVLPPEVRARPAGQRD